MFIPLRLRLNLGLRLSAFFIFLFIFILPLGLLNFNESNSAYASILSTQNNQNKKKEKIFFISHAGAGDPFWSVEFKGAEQAALESGVQLQIVAPEKPNDIARQVELLQAALASNPQGIALSIPDDKAFARPLQEAKRRGIPVVAFNARPSAASVGVNPYDAFIGLDEYRAGQMVGERFLANHSTSAKNLLPTTTTAVVAIHQAGHMGLEQRAKGIIDTLNSIKLKTVKLDITSDATEAQVIMRGFLKKNPQTAAVFCLGPQCLHALGPLFKTEFKNKKIFLSSFDMTPLTLKLIKEGVAQFTVDQQPYSQGYLSVMQLALAARIKAKPASLNTGVSIVDAENVDAVATLVQQGLR